MSSATQSAQSAIITNQNLIKMMTNDIITTLQLLGFDFQSNEKKNKLVFNSVMFSKPNCKAFEVIIHFLFIQLDPERAHKAFDQCWPPILKEQQKEFKDLTFIWLVELTSPKQTSAKNQPQQQPNSLLQHIKFPTITKSLLITPGGYKICELLFALCQFILLTRVIKLNENGRSNFIVWHKVSPFMQNHSSILTNISNELKSGTASLPSTSAKILTQKQILQFDIQTNAFKFKLDHELTKLNLEVAHRLNVRNKWQQFVHEKASAIKMMIERKAQLAQSLTKKKQILYRILNMIEAENVSIEKVYAKFYEMKLKNFREKCARLNQIKDAVWDEKKKEEIVEAIKCQANNNKVDGLDFLRRKTNSEEEVAKFKETLRRISAFLYEKIDEKKGVVNIQVDNLTQENGRKLDLINLLHLYKLILVFKAEMFSKIDKNKLNEFISINPIQNEKVLLGSEEMLISDEQPNTVNLIKSLNEKAAALKNKNDFYFPKLQELCTETLQKAKNKDRILNERNVVNMKKLDKALEICQEGIINDKKISATRDQIYNLICSKAHDSLQIINFEDEEEGGGGSFGWMD